MDSSSAGAIPSLSSSAAVLWTVLSPGGLEIPGTGRIHGALVSGVSEASTSAGGLGLLVLDVRTGSPRFLPGREVLSWGLLEAAIGPRGPPVGAGLPLSAM